MNEFYVVGVNHKSAPVELRERCREDCAQKIVVEDEWFTLVTCNRFEVYGHGAIDHGDVLRQIAKHSGVDHDELARHAYIRQGRNAAKHLYLVASSLDSLVVGETQIRGQVRAAYEAAIERGTIGPFLHRLLQSALRLSKEIADRTGVGRGNVSVAGAAADLAERVFDDLTHARVLIVGAGDTAELLAAHFTGRDAAAVRIVNRHPERAEELATRFDVEWGGLDDLHEQLANADVVVTAATASDKPLLSLRDFRDALRRRRGKPIVAIDVAMPRAVDPLVDRLDNVYRYDMEALETVTKDALRRRRKDFLECCAMIDVAALRLESATRAREAGAAIREVRDRGEALAEQELLALERRLPDLPDEARDAVRNTVRRIVNKLLHNPVRVLREGKPEESELIYRTFSASRREEKE